MENYSLRSGYFKLWLTKLHNTQHCKTVMVRENSPAVMHVYPYKKLRWI